VFGWLRALLGQEQPSAGQPPSDQPAERLEAAKQRLKETIPPLEV
jgi:hypothetical protein